MSTPSRPLSPVAPAVVPSANDNPTPPATSLPTNLDDQFPQLLQQLLDRYEQRSEDIHGAREETNVLRMAFNLREGARRAEIHSLTSHIEASRAAMQACHIREIDSLQRTHRHDINRARAAAQGRAERAEERLVNESAKRRGLEEELSQLREKTQAEYRQWAEREQAAYQSVDEAKRAANTAHGERVIALREIDRLRARIRDEMTPAVTNQVISNLIKECDRLKAQAENQTRLARQYERDALGQKHLALEYKGAILEHQRRRIVAEAGRDKAESDAWQAQLDRGAEQRKRLESEQRERALEAELQKWRPEGLFEPKPAGETWRIVGEGRPVKTAVDDDETVANDGTGMGTAAYRNFHATTTNDPVRLN